MGNNIGAIQLYSFDQDASSVEENEDIDRSCLLVDRGGVDQRACGPPGVFSKSQIRSHHNLNTEIPQGHIKNTP